MYVMQKYSFLEQLFIRTPFYSYLWYELDRVPELLKTAVFKNALWLASPVFYESLSEKEFDFYRLSAKEKHTVYKYYNRMCYRPTPFGSFATFSFSNWSDRLPLLLAPEKEVKVHLLADLPDALRAENHTAVLKRNPLLYPVDNSYRFINEQVDVKGNYTFSIAGLPNEPFYNALLNWLGSHTKSPGEITEWIASWANCSLGDATLQLHFLLETQVLKLGQPRIIDRDDSLVSFAVKESHSLYDYLNTTRKRFYTASERNALAGGTSIEDRCRLEKVIHALQRISQPLEIPAMAAFIKAFKSRFDLALVSLQEALDPDTGVIYNNLNNPVHDPDEPLGGLQFLSPVNGEPQYYWTPLHRLLFSRWKNKSHAEAYLPIALTADDLDKIATDESQKHFPPTTSIIFRKTESGLLVEQAGGATASSLIARFSSFSDQVIPICRDVAAIEREMNPGIIFADIGQLSNTHTDNINRRFRTFDYEIPINVSSALPPERQLRPADLELCLLGNELILFSKTMKKRVVPRLTSAYNHRHTTLSIFQLLCDMQYHGLCASLNIDMEALFPGLDFYPRLTLDGVILQLACWKFDAVDVSVFADGDHGVTRLEEFRKKYQLPNMVALGDTDQQLVFNLSYPPEAKLFIQTLRGLDKITVREYLLPDRSVKTGALPLAAQSVAFLKNVQPVYRAYSYPDNTSLPNLRRYLPGDSWLYLKIFCTPFSADRLLCDLIYPFITENDRLFKQWFFIRYSEGGDHLRIRFKLYKRNGASLLSILNRDIKQRGLGHLIRELQQESYYPEIERYGTGRMEQVESLFHAGSELVLEYIFLVNNDQTDVSSFGISFYLALRAVCQWFATTEQALVFCEQSASYFLTEFQADKKLKVNLDARYRKLSPVFLQLDFVQWPSKFNDKLLNWESQLRSVSVKTVNEPSRINLIGDVLHMQFNRIFTFDQRQSEMVVYYCLFKHLRSLKARKH